MFYTVPLLVWIEKEILQDILNMKLQSADLS